MVKPLRRLNKRQQAYVIAMKVQYPRIIAAITALWPGTIRRVKGVGISNDEIEAAGWEGVVNAAWLFEPKRGLQFSTFAIWHARARIGRLDFKRKHTPSFIYSLDYAPTTGSRTQLEFLAEPAESPSLDDKDSWQRLIRVLHPREQKIITWRYRDNLTLLEIGTLLNLSCERVRQLELRALERMRKEVDCP